MYDFLYALPIVILLAGLATVAYSIFTTILVQPPSKVKNEEAKKQNRSQDLIRNANMDLVSSFEEFKNIKKQQQSSVDEVALRIEDYDFGHENLFAREVLADNGRETIALYGKVIIENKVQERLYLLGKELRQQKKSLAKSGMSRVDFIGAEQNELG